MSSQVNRRPLSRRRFLLGLATAAGSGLLAGCSLGPADPFGTEGRDPTFRNAVPPTPRPAVTPATVADDAELASFMALSAVLTGVDDLDPALGAIYLASLRESSQFDVTVSELLAAAQAEGEAVPATLSELEARGLFDNEATRALADKITEYWYTGVYDTAQGDQVVATWVDALAWQTLVFANAMSVCGSYRFWTEPPEAAID